MKKRYFILLAFLNFIIQSTLLQNFRIMGVIPNTTIILIFIIAVLSEPKATLTFAITAGLLQDSFLTKVLILNLAIYVIISVIVSNLEKPLFYDNPLTPMFIISLSTIFYNLVYLFFMYFSAPMIAMSFISTVVITETIYNTLLGLIIFQFVKRYTVRRN